MLQICKENRHQIENEFMALLLNKWELFDVIQIKPKYLVINENRVLLEACLKCYEKYNVLNIVKMAEEFKYENVEYFYDIMTNFIWFEKAWKEQLKIAEESIVKYYKQDVIKFFNEKLKRNEIKYDEFMENMKKLDDVVLTDNSITLTSKEIFDNINVNNSRIKLNNFSKLNYMLELVKGDFLIIGATTGAGKSGFMLNLMNDLMADYQCIYFNMEMSKSTIYKRLVSIRGKIKVDDVANPQSDYQKKIIENSINEIEKNNLIVEHKANDIKQIRGIVSKLKNKDKHTILFIDHLGLTKVDGTKNLYEQATEVAKQLRQLCLEHDCTVISASQLNRGAYQTEQLSLSMLKDSGELENSASKVILLYKINKDDKNLMTDMVVNIAKNRDGICGDINMVYDKTKQTFIEKENNYE